MKDHSYSVAFYCPDTNIRISGDMAEKRGGGGGKTAIVKMAEALSDTGCKVRVFAYCHHEGIHKGVEYFDLDGIDNQSADVLIALTGHKRDISCLYPRNVKARLKVLWLSGCSFIGNIDDAYFDWYYANSVFLKKRAVLEWKLPFRKVIATHQGYDPKDFKVLPEGGGGRDPLGIVFASHPSKGLDRVAEVVGRLRQDLGEDFTMDVYGGYRLWDDADSRGAGSGNSWMRYRGMISQPELCGRLPDYNFMLHLTDYEDTSSVLIHQAKRAGVIIISSDVGGNSELIESGSDGFIVADPFHEDACYEKVRNLVACLRGNESYAYYIRGNAEKHSMTWDRTASEWLRHWDDVTGEIRRRKVVIAGYYGFRNLGDEAILSCMIKDLRNSDSEVGITVLSGDPFYTEAMHKVKTVPNSNIELLSKEVGEADTVVLGGGGLFQDHYTMKISQFFEDRKYGATSFANVPLMAKIYGKPVIYYAHGVGPFFSKESFLFSRWAFDLADLISVRDEYSYDLATELLGVDRGRITLSFDPVLKTHLPSEKRCKALMINNGIPDGRKLVVVAPRHWINKKLQAKTVDALAESLAVFLQANSDYYCLFVPFDTFAQFENDIGICDEISSRLQGCSSVIKVYDTYEEVLSMYLSAEFSIGMRYHSLIFSALANTPVIAVSYDKKDSELMRDLGLSDFSVEMKDVGSSAISDLIGKVRLSGSMLRERMEKKVGEIIGSRSDSGLILKQKMEDIRRGR